MIRPNVLLAAAALGVAAFASAPSAFAAVYDFEAQDGATTSFAITADGETATFTSPDGQFTVGNSGGLFSALTGNDLINLSYAPAELDISFSAPVNFLSMSFGLVDLLGLGGNDTITLTTNTGETVTATASTVDGFLFPEGFLSIEGAAFTSVMITSPYTFAVDNVTVPEPATLSVLGVGLAGLIASRRRRRAASALAV